MFRLAEPSASGFFRIYFVLIAHLGCTDCWKRRWTVPRRRLPIRCLVNLLTTIESKWQRRESGLNFFAFPWRKLTNFCTWHTRRVKWMVKVNGHGKSSTLIWFLPLLQFDIIVLQLNAKTHKNSEICSRNTVELNILLSHSFFVQIFSLWPIQKILLGFFLCELFSFVNFFLSWTVFLCELFSFGV